VRWMEVIDDDKRLWKALLWQDFKWQKAQRRGKGRAKKNRKDCVYQHQYAALYHQHRVSSSLSLSCVSSYMTRRSFHNKMTELKEKKRQLLEQQRKAKTVKLLQKVGPRHSKVDG
jgi:hypothetical protein